MMRRRSVLQISLQQVTVHPEPLATTEEIAALKAAATAFVAPSPGSTVRTGFYWCGVGDDGVFEPGSQLTTDEVLALSREVRARAER